MRDMERDSIFSIQISRFFRDSTDSMIGFITASLEYQKDLEMKKPAMMDLKRNLLQSEAVTSWNEEIITTGDKQSVVSQVFFSSHIKGLDLEVVA